MKNEQTLNGIFEVGRLHTLKDLMENIEFQRLLAIQFNIMHITDVITEPRTNPTGIEIVQAVQSLRKDAWNIVQLISNPYLIYNYFPTAANASGNLVKSIDDMAKEKLASDDKVFNLKEFESIKSLASGIGQHWGRDCMDNLFLVVKADKKKYYTDEMPFGEAVYNAFPEFREDIINASKCMALDQFEASLYHAINVLELCVEKIARKAKVKSPKDMVGMANEISDKNKNWNPKKKEYISVRDEIARFALHSYNAGKAYRHYIAHKKEDFPEPLAQRAYDLIRHSVEQFVETDSLKLPQSYGQRRKKKP